jgi:hypothetical protein
LPCLQPNQNARNPQIRIMKTQESARLLTGLAPVAVALPPIAIVTALLGIGLLWLASDDEKKPKAQSRAEEDEPTASAPKSATLTQSRKVMREDLAEALAYGEKAFTRKEAVAALAALGVRKTTAYKALAPDGKFASMLMLTPDGLIEWKG